METSPNYVKCPAPCPLCFSLNWLKLYPEDYTKIQEKMDCECGCKSFVKIPDNVKKRLKELYDAKTNELKPDTHYPENKYKNKPVKSFKEMLAEIAKIYPEEFSIILEGLVQMELIRQKKI